MNNRTPASTEINRAIKGLNSHFGITTLKKNIDITSRLRAIKQALDAYGKELSKDEIKGIATELMTEEYQQSKQVSPIQAAVYYGNTASTSITFDIISTLYSLLQHQDITINTIFNLLLESKNLYNQTLSTYCTQESTAATINHYCDLLQRFIRDDLPSDLMIKTLTCREFGGISTAHRLAKNQPKDMHAFLQLVFDLEEKGADKTKLRKLLTEGGAACHSILKNIRDKPKLYAKELLKLVRLDLIDIDKFKPTRGCKNAVRAEIQKIDDIYEQLRLFKEEAIKNNGNPLNRFFGFNRNSGDEGTQTWTLARIEFGYIKDIEAAIQKKEAADKIKKIEEEKKSRTFRNGALVDEGSSVATEISTTNKTTEADHSTTATKRPTSWKTVYPDFDTINDLLSHSARYINDKLDQRDQDKVRLRDYLYEKANTHTFLFLQLAGENLIPYQDFNRFADMQQKIIEFCKAPGLSVERKRGLLHGILDHKEPLHLFMAQDERCLEKARILLAEITPQPVVATTSLFPNLSKLTSPPPPSYQAAIASKHAAISTTPATLFSNKQETAAKPEAKAEEDALNDITFPVAPTEAPKAPATNQPAKQQAGRTPVPA